MKRFNKKLMSHLTSGKPIFIGGKALSHTIKNTVTDVLSEDIEIISNLLKEKFWFGGEAIYPWEHPCNYVKDAMLIRLDGCCAYKFKVHNNGKLRCMRIYSKRFLDLKLKPLETITVQELWKRIAENDFGRVKPMVEI